MASSQLFAVAIAHLTIDCFISYMLPVSFILAALLAAEGVVLAHPIHHARRNELPSVVPRAVPDNSPVAYVIAFFFLVTLVDRWRIANQSHTGICWSPQLAWDQGIRC